MTLTVTAMEGLCLATGFTGGMTVWFALLGLYRLRTPLAQIEAYFSPGGGCADRVVRAIRSARREVLILTEAFELPAVTDALTEVAGRKVKVDILLDAAGEGKAAAELGRLRDAGLAPMVDATHPGCGGVVILVDRHTVLTGSYSLSERAETERVESLAVVRHHRGLSEAYRRHFFRHREHGRAAGETLPVRLAA